MRIVKESAMLTPKKSLNVTNKDSKDNKVMIFENGTVLGSVCMIMDKNDKMPNCNNNSLMNNDEEKYSSPAVIVAAAASAANKDNCENSFISRNCNLLSAQSSLQLSSSPSSSSSSSGCISNENLINCISEQNIENVINESIRSIEIFDTSTCSNESRQSKRIRRKLRKLNGKVDQFPPHYTTIYLDTNSQIVSSTNVSVNHFNAVGVSTGAIPGAVTAVVNPIENGHIPLSVPLIQRNATETTLGRAASIHFFRVPSVPFVIGILALGGVACTLGGIVLGSTGLVEQSTQYLSAALLMIGIGVSLLVISGAVWKLTISDPEPIIDTCPCCRHFEACRNCNSMFCNNRILSGSYIYPEFQHRTPPPSYVTSLNECAIGLLVHDSTNYQQDIRQIVTPPPSYRSYSTNSLSFYLSTTNPESFPEQTNKIDDSVLSDKEPTYVELD